MPYKLKLTEIFLDYFCLTLTSNPVTGKPASECAARPLTELRVSTPVGFGVLNTSTKLYELWPQLTSTAPLYALSGGAEWFVDPATGASYIRMPLTGTTPAQLAAGVKFCVSIPAWPCSSSLTPCQPAWFETYNSYLYPAPPPIELITADEVLITSYELTDEPVNSEGIHPTRSVYSRQFQYSVVQGPAPAAPACGPVCSGNYMYSTQNFYDGDILVNGGGTYSTCAATVSTTGCVNALTNGCRFSTAYINHFALNNPQGCIKCTTNAYGWCGTGSTATYCCAV